MKNKFYVIFTIMKAKNINNQKLKKYNFNYKKHYNKLLIKQ